MQRLDKDFLKEGKVSKLIQRGATSLDSEEFTMLEIAVQTFESLLDDPVQGDTAQENLSKYVHLIITGFAENCHNNPEQFVQWLLDHEASLSTFL